MTLAFALAMLGAAPQVQAGGSGRDASNGGAAAVSLSTRHAVAHAGPADAAAPTTVEGALQAGDLAAARDLAAAATEAEPSADNHLQQAKVLEQSGEYTAAADAYQAGLDALPADATERRAAVKSDHERVQTLARGTVSDEPESTHRAELDERWSPPPPKPTKKKTKRKAPPAVPVDTRDDRIVNKWYFWVTIGAIVASGAAVTAIAIRASRQEQPDALGLQRAPSTQGPAMIRF